jgi:hypothetical protein
MVAVLVLAEVAAAINSSYGELHRDTQNAFSRRLRRLAAQRLRNCAELLRTRVDGRYAGGMSEATPTPVEPPTPSAEQLVQWRTLVEGVRQGDSSQVVAWDEDAAAGPADTYQVLVTHRVHQQLRGAPPLLAGSVAGIVAVLRVDPTEASMIFRRRRLGDAGWTVSFGAAQGRLTYWVLQPERIVVLLDLTWAG